MSVEHFETVRQTKDGRLVDISLTVSPIRDAAGRIVGASKIARDIREHKRLLDERRIAAENEEAARREVLEVQNRRIQEAARLKSEFVANMSHELRTPLNSIVGFAELMADARFGPLPTKYQEFAQIMHASAQHLLQLINDILDLAKVESGKIDFQPEPVDLAALGSRGDGHRHRACGERENPDDGRRRSVARRVHLDPDAAQAGAVQLPVERDQVHARRRPRHAPRAPARTANGSASRWKTPASASGPKTSTACSSSSSSSMRARAKKFPGSGLGLALTKRLVEAQGGTVGVRSVLGSGSTFFATLPQHVTAESAEITVAIDREGAMKTILIVDDDAAGLRLAERILEAEGFETQVGVDAGAGAGDPEDLDAERDPARHPAVTASTTGWSSRGG